MDPNETVDRLREIVKGYNEGEADSWEFERAVELFESLDNWISRGGFLPDAWRPQSRVDALKSRGGF